MGDEKIIAKIREAVGVAKDLKWLHPRRGYNPMMDLAAVEKVLFMALDPNELKRFQNANGDMNPDAFEVVSQDDVERNEHNQQIGKNIDHIVQEYWLANLLSAIEKSDTAQASDVINFALRSIKTTPHLSPFRSVFNTDQ